MFFSSESIIFSFLLFALGTIQRANLRKHFDICNFIAPGGQLFSRSRQAVALEGHHADARTVGDGHFAVDDFHAVKDVVGDQQVAVEVGPVGQRGEL